MSLYRERIVKKTRKPSACYWCQEAIPVGSSKVSIASVWEGDFGASDWHPECKEALKKYQRIEMEGYWPPEGSMKRGTLEEQ